MSTNTEVGNYDANLPHAPDKVPLDHKKLPKQGNVKTHFISILSNGSSYTAKCLTGMVTAMCTATISTLTLASLLQDPLIQMVMRSDNVSQEDHSELLHRVKDSLIARSYMQDVALEATA
jgi:hypothetical protein